MTVNGLKIYCFFLILNIFVGAMGASLFAVLIRSQQLNYGTKHFFFLVPHDQIVQHYWSLAFQQTPASASEFPPLSVEHALIRTFIATGYEVVYFGTLAFHYSIGLLPGAQDFSELKLKEQDGYTINWFRQICFFVGMFTWCWSCCLYVKILLGLYARSFTLRE